MLKGEQRGIFDLQFALPSVCADRLAGGEADIGIVPAIEMRRQRLEYFRGTGIACHGPVRSILLISKTPLREVRTLATDTGSRTSVALSRIILEEKFGVRPALLSRPADLPSMLGEADAALRVDPAALPFETLDLGREWSELTGLPMVFAVWSGRKEMIQKAYEQAFIGSCRYGLAHLDEIVRQESAARNFPEPLVRKYLTEHIVFELGERDYRGLELFLERASKLERQAVAL